jgi:glycosyltransferase involved in cell wall biosynthesis
MTSRPVETANRRKRIAIITGASLANNPRVVKEAATLSAHGFDVTVLGSGSDQMTNLALARRYGFSFEPVGFHKASGLWNQIRCFGHRLRNSLARRFRRFGIESRFQLGPLVDELSRAAELVKADYHIVHLESALWVGSELLRTGCAVGVDFEDWYSEDLLPEARMQRPARLLRSMEQGVLSGARHATCTSHAMAKALANEYACEAPAVIYNAFPWRDRETIDGLTKDRKDRQRPSIHWYSQTLGPGRGLEDLIAALPFLRHEVEIHLRGKPAPGFLKWLDSQLSSDWRNRIIIHEVVPNEELLSRIAEHDIGFAGEQKFCRSRDLTVTNKILHYLLAGLAVVASDTSGQREVAEQTTSAVYLYRVGDPQDLARQLNHLLSSKAELEKAKEAALAAAKETFCWERQASALIAAIQKAFVV